MAGGLVSSWTRPKPAIVITSSWGGKPLRSALTANECFVAHWTIPTSLAAPKEYGYQNITTTVWSFRRDIQLVIICPSLFVLRPEQVMVPTGRKRARTLCI